MICGLLLVGYAPLSYRRPQEDSFMRSMLGAPLLALVSLLLPFATQAQTQASCTFKFFSPTTPLTLSDGTPVFIQPIGINDFGTIVGRTYPNGINDFGAIVGDSRPPHRAPRPDPMGQRRGHLGQGNEVPPGPQRPRNQRRT